MFRGRSARGPRTGLQICCALALFLAIGEAVTISHRARFNTPPQEQQPNVGQSTSAVAVAGNGEAERADRELERLQKVLPDWADKVDPLSPVEAQLETLRKLEVQQLLDENIESPLHPLYQDGLQLLKETDPNSYHEKLMTLVACKSLAASTSRLYGTTSDQERLHSYCPDHYFAELEEDDIPSDLNPGYKFIIGLENSAEFEKTMHSTFTTQVERWMEEEGRDLAGDNFIDNFIWQSKVELWPTFGPLQLLIAAIMNESPQSRWPAGNTIHFLTNTTQHHDPDKLTAGYVTNWELAAARALVALYKEGRVQNLDKCLRFVRIDTSSESVQLMDYEWISRREGDEQFEKLVEIFISVAREQLALQQLERECEDRGIDYDRECDFEYEDYDYEDKVARLRELLGSEVDSKI